MTATDDLAGWCRQQEATLQHQLKVLRSGRMRTWEQRGSGPGMVDTTANTLDQVENSLAELEAIFARSFQ